MKKLFLIAAVLCVALSLTSCLSLLISSDPAETKGEPQTTKAPDDGEFKLSDYVGFWVYNEPSGYLEITDESLWNLYDDDMKLVKSGPAHYDETTKALVLEESETLDFDFIRFNGDGELINSASDVLHPTAKPTIGDKDVERFVGSWEYDDKNVIITVYDNATWDVEGNDVSGETHGECRFEDNMLVLATYDGNDVNFLTFNDDGVLCDSVFDTLHRFDPPVGKDALFEPFIGRWEFVESDEVLVISSDWQWEKYDEDGQLADSGTCRYEAGYGLVLEAGEGNSDVDFLRLSEDGDELFNSANEYLIPAD